MPFNELNNEHPESNFQFVAVRLPYNIQADEDDAQSALEFIKPSHVVTTNIKDGADGIHQQTLTALTQANLLTASDGQIDFL